MEKLCFRSATVRDLDHIMHMEAAGFAAELRESRAVYARRIAAFTAGALIASIGDDDVGCFFSEIWRAGLEVQAMSSRTNWQGSTPGFAITNLTFSAPRLTRNVEASASIYNLFDRRYYDPAGEEQTPIERIEQNGRNFRVKLTYRF